MISFASPIWLRPFPKIKITHTTNSAYKHLFRSLRPSSMGPSPRNRLHFCHQKWVVFLSPRQLSLHFSDHGSEVLRALHSSACQIERQQRFSGVRVIATSNLTVQWFMSVLLLALKKLTGLGGIYVYSSVYTFTHLCIAHHAQSISMCTAGAEIMFLNKDHSHL